MCLVPFFSAVSADSSQDHAIIDLLAGLEDDGFCRTPVRQSSQSQSLPGSRSYCCNSDEEESRPEQDQEEAELSIIMSQRWDHEPPGTSSLPRQVSHITLKLSLYNLLTYASQCTCLRLSGQ